jgi:hypothetical protein
VGTAVAYFSPSGTLLHTGDGVTDDTTIVNNLVAQFGTGQVPESL